MREVCACGDDVVELVDAMVADSVSIEPAAAMPAKSSPCCLSLLSIAWPIDRSIPMDISQEFLRIAVHRYRVPCLVYLQLLEWVAVRW